jgi:hypothetical protein
MRLAGILSVVCTLTCSAALNAADKQFKEVVRTISAELNTRPVHIPLMGLVNVAAFVIRPAGTKHMDLAVFENVNEDHDGREIARRIRKAVGDDWKPYVQTWSNRGGHDEIAMVYMRPEGKNDIKLLVATVGSNDATVVQLKLNPDALARWLKTPRESIQHRDRDRDE